MNNTELAEELRAMNMRLCNKAADALEAAQAEIANKTSQLAAMDSLVNDLQDQRDAALARLAEIEKQNMQLIGKVEFHYDNATPLVELMKEAQAIVESKHIFKKFIRATPLENDIAVWMAEFAKERLAAAGASPEPTEVLIQAHEDTPEWAQPIQARELSDEELNALWKFTLDTGNPTAGNAHIRYVKAVIAAINAKGLS